MSPRRPDAPGAEDFVAASLAAEASGAFAAAFSRTSPSARRIVRSLSGKTGRAEPGGALFGFLGLAAASLFGFHGAAAAALGPATLAGPAVSAGSALFRAAAAAVSATASGHPDPDSKPAGKDTAVLHFRSSGSPATLGAWKADIRIPVSGEGAAIVRLRAPRRASGTFSFCGVSVPITDGRGEIPLPALRASLSRGGVSFALPGSSPVPGAPFLEV